MAKRDLALPKPEQRYVWSSGEAQIFNDARGGQEMHNLGALGVLQLQDQAMGKV